MNDRDMVALKQRGRELGVKVVILHDSRKASGTGSLWTLRFPDHGGQCPFLGEDNLCRAYDVRPNCCRVFPDKPYRNCLVWPGGDNDREV